MREGNGIVEGISLGIKGLSEGSAHLFDLWGHVGASDSEVKSEQRAVLLAEWETTAADLRLVVRRCLSA